MSSAWRRRQRIWCIAARYPRQTAAGTFFAPTLVEIDDIGALTEEVFGPVLHVVKFKSRYLDKMLAAVNATGFGLTMGLHSRIDSRARGVAAHCGAGNLYVNRNMIGAVVGVQPFGGRGLSGTGPKAGGPHYVQRFAHEHTVSNNISAVGGNASLLDAGGPRLDDRRVGVSVFDIFKIGIGPSSSHTVGPMKAARAFVDDLVSRGLLGSTWPAIGCSLYGSLGLTGKGHGTDRRSCWVLSGIDPRRSIRTRSRQSLARIRSADGG